MVISFRLSGRGLRIHPLPPLPPPPPSASAHAVDDSRPNAAASLDVPPPPPRPSCEVAISRRDTGITARSELADRNETVAAESDLEPSFALNLFPDGYSVGEPGKGMLLYLIGDDPKKQPYSRASRALLSDIEHGCLPQDILHGIPCKFLNGSTICEVRDYRSVFCNGDDYSGDDFPRVNRIHLRLGTECIVKDLSSIADASWTYHDQLTAESIILNALQPKLNLDPTPCLEMLCNSSAKEHNKDTSVLIMSTNAPENCKPMEFSICEGTTQWIENAALEGIPSGISNSLSVNSPSTIHVNNAESAIKSDTNNTIQSFSNPPNSSALCDRMQCASDTAPEHLFQSNEQRAQVEILQEDRKTGQPRRVTVLPQNTKKLSSLLHEKNESKKCSPPNNNGRSCSQNSKGLHKSTSSANKEELDLGSQKRLQVEAKLGQTIGNKDMEVQNQVPLSVPPRDPCTPLNTTNPGIEKIPERVKLLHIVLKEHHGTPTVDSNNSDMVDVNDRGAPFVVSFSRFSRKAVEPLEDMAATTSQGTASKRKSSEISINSLNQEINLKGKKQQNVDTQIKPACKNRSFEEPAVTGGVSSQLHIDLELHKGRQKIKDSSLLNISANAPERCKPNEFNVCKVVAVCSENAALEGMPSVRFLNYQSSIHVNNAKSIVESDPGSTIRSSFALANSSALCDRKQGGSITPAPDHLLQSNEEKAQVTVLQVDRENRQTQRVAVVPQKRKKSLKLLNGRHESKNCSPPNKSARLSSQNSKGQKSTGSSKEGLHLRSPKGPQVEVKVGQTIVNKDMKVQKKMPLSVHSSCHPCTSLNTSNLCVEKIPEKIKSLHIMLNERHKAPIVDLKNSDMADPKGSRTASVISFSANSTKASCESGEDKTATGFRLKALNRKVIGISTISLNQEINLNGERQQNLHIEPPCENRSLEEPAITGGVNSQFGISTHLRSCSGYPINYGEPDIEKILSEVILTTQRHGLHEKAAKSDVLETSWSLPPCEFFQCQNDEEIPSMRDETMTCNVSDGVTRTWKIRKLTFHPSQYSSCNGVFLSCRIICFLIEPYFSLNPILYLHIRLYHKVMLPLDFSLIHEMVLQCHAEKFVDQFISLMKRDGYNLCDDEVCNESSELRQWGQEVPMDQYFQYRHNIPWFGNAYSTSMTASSYDQWRQVYTQMGSVVYQWDLPALSRQIHSNLPLHDGRSIPLSELQLRSLQMSSRSMDFDGSITSTPVQIPISLSYQYPMECGDV
ncbi:hypothetical protein BAE44_0021852 [Dichanthelium oligosanthes]|uniref:Spt20-like SEP domain-containing protein n=1 Tax=Dichanthelium oligosanthes TaxID=888268 RepID=A0A1E5UW62_9POAL|nr:hypothetical protein BAE44_0021852 [Dichanthelium oligosanthes]